MYLADTEPVLRAIAALGGTRRHGVAALVPVPATPGHAPGAIRRLGGVLFGVRLGRYENWIGVSAARTGSPT